LSLVENNEKNENAKKSNPQKNTPKIIIKPLEKEYSDHTKFLKKELKKNYF